MGGKKQDSISNFFIEIPPLNRDAPNPALIPHSEPPNSIANDYIQPSIAPVGSFPTTAPNETLPAMTDVLLPPTSINSARVVHPFFDKEASKHGTNFEKLVLAVSNNVAGLAIQKTKPHGKPERLATTTSPKILNDASSKVTKPRKRSRRRKDTSISTLAIHDELIESVFEEVGNSDGDFPTPPSAHSSDFEDSGQDELDHRNPTKKRRKHIRSQASLPSPPRSSENELVVSSGPIGIADQDHTLSLAGQSDIELVSQQILLNQNNGNNGTEADFTNQPKVDDISGAPAARSAFDLMKKSSSTTKTRSRSISPPPPGTDGPPAKKARTRGRPRKSGIDVVDLTIENLKGLPSLTLPAPRPSLVVKLKIGKEAAERLANPPEKKSLIVILKVPKEQLEKFIPKPHPFFMKTSEKRKQAAVSEDSPNPPIKTNPFPSKPAVNFLSSFQPKPKFKIEYHPAWPTKENIHVRNIEELAPTPQPHYLKSTSFRKGKARGSDISPAESTLEILRNRYTSIYNKYLYKDDPMAPPRPQPTVRLPEKKLGRASYVMNFLKEHVVLGLSSEFTHPAIRTLIERVKNPEVLLTAFDNNDCEGHQWTSLYAPTSSACVLQSGQEAKELSKWLMCMKITAVDTGLNSKPKAPQVKKKKKTKNELDDFIVSEEEDRDSMDEITDPEDVNVLFPGLNSSKNLRKSEIRRRSRSAVTSVASKKPRTTSPPPKLPNAILVSGPSGVGKTAAIYAAAKEHDFVVFEINAGTKRGGKEIQEMVGDMSRNHLVHQAKAFEQTTALEPEPSKSNALNSFFAKKGPIRPKQPGDAEEPEDSKEKVQQQQSLILIEEADILFEEDNGFWRSIIALIQKSRRPVVITCNDESLLPLEDLDLYAKLRFKPASPDLAADYLLVMAAAQGHFLDRTIIRRLYEKYNYDLRRTITQLSFWCQMAIGDHAWTGRYFYTRDDPEKSQDSATVGGVKRSISGGTYFSEMASFGRELLIGDNGDNLAASEYDETAIWKDVVDGSGVDLGDRFYHGGLAAWMQTTENDKNSLNAFSGYIDSLSMLDAYVGAGVYTGDEPKQTIDPSQSSLRDKRSPDNLVDVKVLDAEQKPDNLSTSSLLSITGQILARNVLRNANQVVAKGPFATFSESDIVNMISTKREFDQIRKRKRQHELRYPFEKIMNGHTQLIRPVSILVDTIPYIREIVRFDQQNEEVAREMSSLISQRPSGAGKKRTTRAAAFASEGRSRGGGRPLGEQYFRGSIGAMLSTGGAHWGDSVELYTYRPTPEPEPEPEPVTLSIVQVVFDEVHVAREQVLETTRQDEIRQSRRKVIHDDIEEWPSEM
ncbi:hypothetical protein TWF694_002325 [Orbilia ellipsospora]|uniref:AAA+ ATPase domain-containing protein n=1 Tax=Orbilia ellipsospora TaxID=2528407 RepID=A0AAV9X448_9PEZI